MFHFTFPVRVEYVRFFQLIKSQGVSQVALFRLSWIVIQDKEIGSCCKLTSDEHVRKLTTNA